MRKFFAFLSMLAVAGASLAQEGEFKGYLEVTHGFVTNTFGQKVSIAGMWLPYWEKDIKATKMVDGKPIELDQPTQNRILDATVYNANAGSGYGYSEDNPSSLDDITMSGGAGAAWKHLTFGMAVEYTGQPFIIRWIGYNNYTTGRGAGVSAFDGVINDFGVRWPAESAPRQVIVTIDVSVAGMVAPSNKLYLAQQFRFNQANGEGPFIPVWTVFNASAPPTVGSSEDFFFFDSDPAPDGIYDETEIDNFGSGGLANHVLTILTGGTQESLVPFSYQLFRGQETGGGITDLWFSDNSFYTAKAGIVLNRTESPVQLIVEGISSTANVSSVKFMFEGGATANGVNRQLALFNYTLNEWVVISTGPATVADEVFEYTIPGSPAAYVNQSTRRLRARVSYHPTASVPRSWAARVDRMAWSITRP